MARTAKIKTSGPIFAERSGRSAGLGKRSSGTPADFLAPNMAMKGVQLGILYQRKGRPAPKSQPRFRESREGGFGWVQFAQEWLFSAVALFSSRVL
jgi:hypothetical protein